MSPNTIIIKCCWPSFVCGNVAAFEVWAFGAVDSPNAYLAVVPVCVPGAMIS